MEVGLALVAADAVAGAPIARRDIGFHADNRLDSRFFGLFLEFPRPVEVAVIGDGEGWLLELEGPGDQVIDAVGAIEK